MLPVAAITRRIRRQVIYWRWLMAAALVGCIPVALICSFLVHHFLAGLKRSSTEDLILDVLLVTGVLLNALKASDLLLRRGRQPGLPGLLQHLARRCRVGDIGDKTVRGHG
jgi:hypothetical protein